MAALSVVLVGAAGGAFLARMFLVQVRRVREAIEACSRGADAIVPDAMRRDPLWADVADAIVRLERRRTEVVTTARDDALTEAARVIDAFDPARAGSEAGPEPVRSALGRSARRVHDRLHGLQKLLREVAGSGLAILSGLHGLGEGWSSFGRRVGPWSRQADEVASRMEQTTARLLKAEAQLRDREASQQRAERRIETTLRAVADRLDQVGLQEARTRSWEGRSDQLQRVLMSFTRASKIEDRTAGVAEAQAILSELRGANEDLGRELGRIRERLGTLADAPYRRSEPASSVEALEASLRDLQAIALTWRECCGVMSQVAVETAQVRETIDPHEGALKNAVGALVPALREGQIEMGFEEALLARLHDELDAIHKAEGDPTGLTLDGQSSLARVQTQADEVRVRLDRMASAVERLSKEWADRAPAT